tara:strand:+ start:173 stop:430 length:258 start_codon:yes stop_codon:yes gene_type:complete
MRVAPQETAVEAAEVAHHPLARGHLERPDLGVLAPLMTFRVLLLFIRRGDALAFLELSQERLIQEMVVEVDSALILLPQAVQALS